MSTTRVDVNVPRFNQAMVALLVGIAFVLQWWPLVAATAVVLGATRFGGPRWGAFTRAYGRLIRPLLAGPIETEPADPPRFAQLLGFLFLTGSSVLLLAGFSVAGWLIALGVFALGLLAATTQICVGCIIFQRVTG